METWLGFHPTRPTCHHFPEGPASGLLPSCPSAVPLAVLSCAGAASDQFSLLASQGRIGLLQLHRSSFSHRCTLAPVLIRLPTSFLLLRLRDAAGAVATLSRVESGPLPRPRRRRSLVPSGWLNHSGRSLVLPHINYWYLTTWLTVTAKQLFLSLPAWEGG